MKKRRFKRRFSRIFMRFISFMSKNRIQYFIFLADNDVSKGDAGYMITNMKDNVLTWTLVNTYKQDKQFKEAFNYAYEYLKKKDEI